MITTLNNMKHKWKGYIKVLTIRHIGNTYPQKLHTNTQTLKHTYEYIFINLKTDEEEKQNTQK